MVFLPINLILWLIAQATIAWSIVIERLGPHDSQAWLHQVNILEPQVEPCSATGGFG